MISLLILGGLLVLLISGILFLNFYPSIGGSQSTEKVEMFKKSDHYNKGVFVNQIHTSMDMSFSKIMSIISDRIRGIPQQVPENPVPILPLDSGAFRSKPDSLVRVTWFGHSTILLEIAGNIQG